MLKTTVVLLAFSSVVALTCAKSVKVPTWAGMVKSRGEQCIDLGFAGTCKFEKPEDKVIENSCIQLQCGKATGNGHLISYGFPVAEGSFCGPSKACINGECVQLEADQLPKYTGEETRLDNCY